MGLALKRTTMPAKPAVNATKKVRLNKGDILFREGERSRAMFILQEGSLRLFKKKGQGAIELAVIHRGEVIGEMAFFDGEPRSASAEALSPCKLQMISFDVMQKQLEALPSWVATLIQCVVKRLRATSTKVKQLESNSITYSVGKAGTYVYFSNQDILKFMASLILVSSRYGKDNGKGEKIVNPTFFQLIASSMFLAPLSKLMDFLDIMQEQGLVSMEKHDDTFSIIVHQLDLIDSIMHFIYKENNKADNKKLKITINCLKLLRCAYKFSKNMKGDGETGSCTISLKSAVEKYYPPEKAAALLSADNWDEAVKQQWASAMMSAEDGDVTVELNLNIIKKAVPAVSLLHGIDMMNEKKRENA